MADQLPPGYRLLHDAEAVSTNSLALEAAREGDPGALWIIADRQTGGRGSRGRTWVGLDGNLFCSLLLVDPAPGRHFPELTFVMALAARDAISDCVKEAGIDREVALKWPNDVLLEGAKVSGILLESHRANERQCVIAGIGVNCTAHPGDTRHPATDLKSCGLEVPASDFFPRLAEHVDERLTQWRRGEGFPEIRRDWLAHAKGRGERIRVELANGSHEGIFENLDHNGHLQLRMNDGRLMTFSAADIFLLAG